MSREVQQSAPKHSQLQRTRRMVLLIVFLFIVAGLIFRTGWGTLSSLGIGVVASLCPLGALETFVASHTFVPRLVIMMLVAVLMAALLGRTFCAWVCPVLPISTFFHPNKKQEKQEERGKQEKQAHDKNSVDAQSQDRLALAPVGGKRDGLQIDSRHGVLAGALVSSAICGFPVFCLVCPVGLTFATVVCVYRTFVEHAPSWSLAVFVLILLCELVFFRKWCHKLCPMGALFSLLGARSPLAKARVDSNKCLRSCGVDCRTCVDACPELLDPHSLRIPECSACGLCIAECPSKAISFKLRTKNVGLGRVEKHAEDVTLPEKIGSD